MRLFVLLLSALLWLSACGDSPLLNHKRLPLISDDRAGGLFDLAADLKIKLDWPEGLPGLGKKSSLMVNLQDEKGDPWELADDETLFVSLWMPEMNHGSSPTVLTEKSRSQFLVEKLYFSMLGLWTVRVWIVDRDKTFKANLDQTQAGVRRAFDLPFTLE